MSLTTTPTRLNAIDHNTRTSSHAGASLVVVENLPESGREGLGLAAVAELAAQETAVVTREHGRRLTEELGGGDRCPSGEHAHGLLADGDHDPGRRRGQPVE